MGTDITIGFRLIEDGIEAFASVNEVECFSATGKDPITALIHLAITLTAEIDRRD
jgi:hypothetical protein